MSVVHTDIQNNLGIITINSEKTLNALSLEIVHALKQILLDWQKDNTITCIFLQGAGSKAFCAGGDIRQVRSAIEEQKKVDSSKVSPTCLEYFITEYSLDYLIHTYNKPIVVWGDGIVMGGGLGLLAGASHRVVTERSLLAMPEVSIGLYPDVGASYFLNKMPSAYGLYLGLTGTRFSGSDALFLGIADYYLSSTAKEQVLNKLVDISSLDNLPKHIATILQNNSVPTKDIPPSIAKEHKTLMTLVEKVNSVDEFDALIEPIARHNEWVSAGYAFFSKGSPTSVHVIFKQLVQSKNYSLEQVFKSELNLTCQFTIHPDFSEGVRALLVDKDQSPRWTPQTTDLVTSDWIQSHFKSLWTEDNHPFKNLKQ